ncbi:MAG: acetate--CoA ligase family protein [Candidatus Ranarchaeia archaeon]
MGASQLDPFFNPKAVAVIGATDNPTKLGYIIYRGLIRSGYQGQVIPVNIKEPIIHGVKAKRTVLETSENVDLAIVVIPAKYVIKTMYEIAEKGIKNVVIVSGGFKELGGEGEAIEQRLRDIIKRHNIRVIGPNCIGVFDAKTRVESFFQSPERMLRPKPGSIAFLTQSGTYGCSFLEQIAESPLGISKFVSYGNRVDVDEAELIEYFAEDPQTKIIALYVEGLDNGSRFLRAAKRITAKKPIIVLKAGRTEQGSLAAKSHTGWLGGTYQIYQAAFRQARIHVAETFTDLFDKTKALAMQPVAKGPNVGMVSNGMGPMVMAIDNMVKLGLSLARLSSESMLLLSNVLSKYHGLKNPVDITGSATANDYRIALEILIDDPNVDIVIPFFVFQDTPLEESIVDELAHLNTKGKPILGSAYGGPYTRKMSNKVESVGIPMFPLPSRAVSAAYALYYQGKVMQG